MRIEYVLIAMALLGNAILAGVSLYGEESAFLKNLSANYGAIAYATVNAIGSIALLIFAKPYAPAALAGLFAHAAALIFMFAGLHANYGLLRDGEIEFVDKTTAVYFSIVTWTTLGYGDYAPHPDLRLLAAIEALLGLAFFGLLIGVAVHFVTKRLD